MARNTIVAAGGIVVQPGAMPRIALVRLRKSDEWVLPKGKLAKGETSLAAAVREVMEETGVEVQVHEFLGSMTYAVSSSRPKVVHFWRMQPTGAPPRTLMKDVTAMEWLPLGDALRRLDRSYERTFLTEVGPLAIASATGTSTAPAVPGSLPTQPMQQPGLWSRIWRWLTG